MMNQIKTDLVFRKGAVYTSEKGERWAEAVAVRNEKIVFVGSNEAVSDYIGSHTNIIDLNGRMLLPGFIDSHAHASAAFDEKKTLSLHGLLSLSDYQKALKTFITQHPTLKVIYGAGWDNSVFPPGGPIKEDLDVISPDRPVSLQSTDYHSVWANSKAIEMAGINKNTPDPPGGRIERDQKTHEPSGTFRENACDLIQNALPPYSVFQLMDSIRIYEQQALRLGITAVHDPMLLTPEGKGMLMGAGVLRNNLLAYKQMAENRELTIRVRGSMLVTPDKGINQVENLLKACDFSHPLFKVNGAKIFVDGVVEGETAYLSEPYTHKPDYRGEPLWKQDLLDTLFVAIDSKGCQIHVHVTGDAGLKMALDAFDHMRTKNGVRDSRHIITHLHVVDYEDIPRFAELGIVGVPQPFWHLKGKYFHELEEKYLGPERAEKEYPMKSFLDAGVILASASDYPVQVPSSPLEGIQIGITRCEPGETNPKEVLGPNERISLMDMLDSFTINGAFANFMEHETGSIKVGKKADMVILDKNLFEIPPSEIINTSVVMTVFDGRIIYDELN